LLLPEEVVVAELESPQPLARAEVSSLLLGKMARDKVVEAVHKLLVDTGEQLTEQEPQVQLVRYLPVEPVVLATSMEVAVEAVATLEEAVAAPILTAQVMMRELVEVDPLLQILTTHLMSHTLLE
jgi:hypothetical protein